MKVEVTKLPESKVTLAIELSPEEVDQALDRTYKQLVGRVNIPGFRKGRAPRAIVERALGSEVFLHEGTDEAVRWGYRKAIDQEHLTPLDEAQLDENQEHLHLHPGESFSYSVTVTVEPEVQLPDLSAIRVERTELEVTDDDVQNLLQDLRDRNATLEPINRPAETGDVLTMNIRGTTGGEEVLNQENADFGLVNEEESGPHAQLPGLSAQLVGVTPGDIREIALALPESYADSDLAGKTLSLTVLVKEVKHPVPPDLNDEFASTVSRFETLDELKGALRENLAAERARQANLKLVNDSVEAVVSRSFVEVPPVLVEEELNDLMNELVRGLEARGISFDLYQQVASKTEEDLRAEMRDEAVRGAKTTVVLNAVAERESIEVSSRDVDTAIEEIITGAGVTGPERRRVRNSSSLRTTVRNRLRRQKTVEKLVEIVSGGIQVLPEDTEDVVDSTAEIDTEDTVAVEAGG